MYKNSKSRQQNRSSVTSSMSNSEVRTLQNSKIITKKTKRQTIQKQNNPCLKNKNNQFLKQKGQIYDQKQQYRILVAKKQRIQVRIKKLEFECQQLNNQLQEYISPQIVFQGQKQGLIYKMQDLQLQINNQNARYLNIQKNIQYQKQNYENMLVLKQQADVNLWKHKMKAQGLKMSLKNLQNEIWDLRKETQSIEIKKLFDDPKKSQQYIEYKDVQKNYRELSKKIDNFDEMIKIIRLNMCIRRIQKRIMKQCIRNIMMRHVIKNVVILGLRSLYRINVNYIKSIKCRYISRWRKQVINYRKQQNMCIKLFKNRVEKKNKSKILIIWKNHYNILNYNRQLNIHKKHAFYKIIRLFNNINIHQSFSIIKYTKQQQLPILLKTITFNSYIPQQKIIKVKNHNNTIPQLTIHHNHSKSKRIFALFKSYIINQKSYRNYHQAIIKFNKFIHHKTIKSLIFHYFNIHKYQKIYQSQEKIYHKIKTHSNKLTHQIQKYSYNMLQLSKLNIHNNTSNILPNCVHKISHLYRQQIHIINLNNNYILKYKMQLLSGYLMIRYKCNKWIAYENEHRRISEKIYNSKIQLRDMKNKSVSIKFKEREYLLRSIIKKQVKRLNRNILSNVMRYMLKKCDKLKKSNNQIKLNNIQKRQIGYKCIEVYNKGVQLLIDRINKIYRIKIVREICNRYRLMNIMNRYNKYVNRIDRYLMRIGLYNIQESVYNRQVKQLNVRIQQQNRQIYNINNIIDMNRQRYIKRIKRYECRKRQLMNRQVKYSINIIIKPLYWDIFNRIRNVNRQQYKYKNMYNILNRIRIRLQQYGILRIIMYNGLIQQYNKNIQQQYNQQHKQLLIISQLQHHLEIKSQHNTQLNISYHILQSKLHKIQLYIIQNIYKYIHHQLIYKVFQIFKKQYQQHKSYYRKVHKLYHIISNTIIKNITKYIINKYHKTIAIRKIISPIYKYQLNTLKSYLSNIQYHHYKLQIHSYHKQQLSLQHTNHNILQKIQHIEYIILQYIQHYKHKLLISHIFKSLSYQHQNYILAQTMHQKYIISLQKYTLRKFTTYIRYQKYIRHQTTKILSNSFKSILLNCSTLKNTKIFINKITKLSFTFLIPFFNSIRFYPIDFQNIFQKKQKILKLAYIYNTKIIKLQFFNKCKLNSFKIYKSKILLKSIQQYINLKIYLPIFKKINHYGDKMQIQKKLYKINKKHWNQISQLEQIKDNDSMDEQQMNICLNMKRKQFQNKINNMNELVKNTLRCKINKQNELRRQVMVIRAKQIGIQRCKRMIGGIFKIVMIRLGKIILGRIKKYVENKICNQREQKMRNDRIRGQCVGYEIELLQIRLRKLIGQNIQLEQNVREVNMMRDRYKQIKEEQYIIKRQIEQTQQMQQIFQQQNKKLKLQFKQFKSKQFQVLFSHRKSI